MSEVTSRLNLKGKLGAADAAVSKRYVDGLKQLRAISKRVKRNSDEWQARGLILGST